MPKLRIDKAFSPTKVTKTDEGFLFITAPIAHSGIYKYRQADGTIINEWVPEETLFDEASLETLQMKPVTNNHPSDFVTSNDSHYKTVGSVGQKFLREGGKLFTDFTVMDEAAIAAVESGKEQLSPAYTCDVEMTSGTTPNGEKYDAIQRNRKYNHLALVNKGRGGNEITLRTDCAMEVCDEDEPNRGGTMPRITIDGVEHEVGSDAVASHISALTVGKKDAEEKLGTAKAELVTAKAKEDSLTADLVAAKANTETEEKFQARVDSRVALIATAASICGEELKTDGSDLDIQKQVILKLQPTANFDGVEEKDLALYAKARFDMAVEGLVGDAAADQRENQEHGDEHNDEDVKPSLGEHIGSRYKQAK